MFASLDNADGARRPLQRQPLGGRPLHFLMLRPLKSGSLGASQIAEVGKANVGPSNSIKNAVRYDADKRALRSAAIEGIGRPRMTIFRPNFSNVFNTLTSACDGCVGSVPSDAGVTVADPVSRRSRYAFC